MNNTIVLEKIIKLSRRQKEYVYENFVKIAKILKLSQSDNKEIAKVFYDSMKNLGDFSDYSVLVESGAIEEASDMLIDMLTELNPEIDIIFPEELHNAAMSFVDYAENLNPQELVNLFETTSLGAEVIDSPEVVTNTEDDDFNLDDLGDDSDIFDLDDLDTEDDGDLDLDSLEGLFAEEDASELRFEKDQDFLDSLGRPPLVKPLEGSYENGIVHDIFSVPMEMITTPDGTEMPFPKMGEEYLLALNGVEKIFSEEDGTRDHIKLARDFFRFKEKFEDNDLFLRTKKINASKYERLENQRPEDAQKVRSFYEVFDKIENDIVGYYLRSKASSGNINPEEFDSVFTSIINGNGYENLSEEAKVEIESKLSGDPESLKFISGLSSREANYLYHSKNKVNDFWDQVQYKDDELNSGHATEMSFFCKECKRFRSYDSKKSQRTTQITSPSGEVEKESRMVFHSDAYDFSQGSETQEAENEFLERFPESVHRFCDGKKCDGIKNYLNEPEGELPDIASYFGNYSPLEIKGEQLKINLPGEDREIVAVLPGTFNRDVEDLYNEIEGSGALNIDETKLLLSNIRNYIREHLQLSPFVTADSRDAHQSPKNKELALKEMESITEYAGDIFSSFKRYLFSLHGDYYSQVDGKEFVQSFEQLDNKGSELLNLEAGSLMVKITLNSPSKTWKNTLLSDTVKNPGESQAVAMSKLERSPFYGEPSRTKWAAILGRKIFNPNAVKIKQEIDAAYREYLSREENVSEANLSQSVKERLGIRKVDFPSFGSETSFPDYGRTKNKSPKYQEIQREQGGDIKFEPTEMALGIPMTEEIHDEILSEFIDDFVQAYMVERQESVAYGSVDSPEKDSVELSDEGYEVDLKEKKKVITPVPRPFPVGLDITFKLMSLPQPIRRKLFELTTIEGNPEDYTMSKLDSPLATSVNRKALGTLLMDYYAAHPEKAKHSDIYFTVENAQYGYKPERNKVTDSWGAKRGKKIKESDVPGVSTYVFSKLGITMGGINFFEHSGGMFGSAPGLVEREVRRREKLLRKEESNESWYKLSQLNSMNSTPLNTTSSVIITSPYDIELLHMSVMNQMSRYMEQVPHAMVSKMSYNEFIELYGSVAEFNKNNKDGFEAIEVDARIEDMLKESNMVV